MMKRYVVVLMTMSVMVISPSAFAQNKAIDRQEFVNMELMHIDGQHRTPDLFKASEGERAKFTRLSRLKKSVLPQVMETAESSALQ